MKDDDISVSPLGKAPVAYEIYCKSSDRSCEVVSPTSTEHTRKRTTKRLDGPKSCSTRLTICRNQTGHGTQRRVKLERTPSPTARRPWTVRECDRKGGAVTFPARIKREYSLNRDRAESSELEAYIERHNRSTGYRALLGLSLYHFCHNFNGCNGRDSRSALRVLCEPARRFRRHGIPRRCRWDDLEPPPRENESRMTTKKLQSTTESS